MTDGYEREDILDRLLELETYLAEHPERGAFTLEAGRRIADPAQRLRYYTAMLRYDSEMADMKARYQQPPVPPSVFVDHPHFVGQTARLWPGVREAYLECCSGRYVESVWTGSIGTGKTTAALYVTAYYLYRTLLLNDVHDEYEMDPSSEVVVALQSIRGASAHMVDYLRLRRIIETSPWFRENAPHDPELKSMMKFRDSPVVVQALGGLETGAIGENVIGGVIDEINHMPVVTGSARARDGGTWDQARENYEALRRRRDSRFQRRGVVPGMLCLVGSANYAGQFTDQKRAERDDEIARRGRSSIFLFDKRPWEVQPPDRFSESRFRVAYAAGQVSLPRVLDENEPVPEGWDVLEVPDNYETQFRADPVGAMRDVAGIPTGSEGGFLPNAEAVAAAFGAYPNVFDPDWCDFGAQPARLRRLPIERPDLPRFCHVDLALSVDSAALAFGYLEGFTDVDRGGVYDRLPVTRIEGLLSVRPRTGQQIEIAKVRKIVYTLRKMGYPIEYLTLDGFQSAEFLQNAREARLRAGIQSLDRRPTGYMVTKSAILDGRVHGPDNELVRKEFTGLQWLATKQKVDHPPGGSKDLSDAVSGVVYGLFRRRELWAAHGVSHAYFVQAQKSAEGDVDV